MLTFFGIFNKICTKIYIFYFNNKNIYPDRFICNVFSTIYKSYKNDNLLEESLAFEEVWIIITLKPVLESKAKKTFAH